MYHFCMFLTGSQINYKLFLHLSKKLYQIITFHDTKNVMVAIFTVVSVLKTHVSKI